MGLNKRLFSGGAPACPTDLVQAFGTDAAYSSNKLLYQFENNVTNTVGSPTAANSGATFSSSTVKLGSYSAEFAGTTQHIKTGYSENDTSLTHSFWMYQQSISGSYNGILGNYWNGGGAVYGYYLWCDDPGTALNWRVHTSNAAYVQVTGTISLNTWYHVVVTWSNGVGAAIYIDGVLAQFTASSLSRQQNSQQIALGNIDSRGTSTVGYDGLIDQYRYYNRVVSASEANTLYAETNATTSNTNLFNEGAGVALYTFDYDASDAGRLYDGAPNNVAFGIEGKTNTGARFNGNNSRITLPGISAIPTNSSPNKSYSVSFWINSNATRLNSTSGSYRSGQIFGFYDDTYSMIGFGGNTNSSFPTGKLFYYNYGGVGQRNNWIITPNSYADDNWHHVVVTDEYVSSGNTRNRKLYVDGSLIVSDSQANTWYPSAAGNTIGSQNTNNQLDADVDQARIFSKVLIQTEINTLYNSGNGEIACVYTATTNDINYPTTNAAYYKLDNSSDDFSTGGNDGTDTNIEYRFGRFGQAAVFNGSNSKIDLGNNSSNNSSTISVSLWFKTTGHSSTATLINNGGSNSGETGYFLGLNSNGTIKFEAGTGAVNGSVNYADNIWHHIALTLNSGAYNIYVDGDTTPVMNGSGAFTSTATRPTWIGQFSYASSNIEFFNGLIDQVRIFNSALSAFNVTDLYNEKPEVDTSNFKAVLYEGNGGTNFVSNVGFEPDLVWIKSRDGAHDNVLYDVVRGEGSGKALVSNATYAEGAYDATYGFLDTFEATGSVVKTGSSYANYTNKNNESYVAWNWKAGGEAVQNNNGTIPSNVSANVEAGFSITTYTGNGYPNAGTPEVGHGLSQTPEITMIKAYSGTGTGGGTGYWVVGSSHVPVDPYAGGFYFNTDGAYYSSINYFWSGTPTDEVVKLNTDWYVNGLNNQYVMYNWHSVAGYSKIGVYTGNGTTSNTVSAPSFEPSLVIIKRTDSTSNWRIFDSARGTNVELYANSSAADTSATGYINFNSNGFEITTTGGWLNANSGTYLYMAFK